MAGRKAPVINLRRKLRRKLEEIVRRHKASARLVLRCRIVLLAADGLTNVQIAKRLNIEERTVGKWRTRLAACRKLRSLRDVHRTGRPNTIPMEVRAEVIKLACDQPDKRKVPFRDLWTLGALREAVHRETGHLISTSEIRRILEGCDLKPHRVRIWLKSRDPMFRQKVKAVCDVYVNRPAPGDVVLCIDEKPGMQALQHKHPFRPPTIGVAGRREFEYIRNGTRNLFAAFNPHTGEVFGRVTKRRKADDLMSFMEQVARRHPTGTVTIVWDNLNIHKGQRWVAFNERHGNRFRFVFTPLHASWCNQVEVWFSILQRRVLKHNSFKSVDELAAQVKAFIEHWNEWEAHPFRWKFRGDFISRAA